MNWNNTTTNICLMLLVSALFITIVIFRSIGEALFILTIIILSKIKFKR